MVVCHADQVAVLVIGDAVVLETVSVGGQDPLAAGPGPCPLPRFEPTGVCVGVVGASAVSIAFVRQPAAIGVVVPSRHGGAAIAREVLPGLHGLHAPSVVVGVLDRIGAAAPSLFEQARGMVVAEHTGAIRLIHLVGTQRRIEMRCRSLRPFTQRPRGRCGHARHLIGIVVTVGGRAIARISDFPLAPVRVILVGSLADLHPEIVVPRHRLEPTVGIEANGVRVVRLRAGDRTSAVGPIRCLGG